MLQILIQLLYEAISDLKNNHQLVIKQSDKGGNIVVMDTSHYEYMVMDILNNREWYRPILELFLGRIMTKFRNLITQAHSNNLMQKRYHFLM